jgi:hypothetical protein
VVGNKAGIEEVAGECRFHQHDRFSTEAASSKEHWYMRAVSSANEQMRCRQQVAAVICADGGLAQADWCGVD